MLGYYFESFKIILPPNKSLYCYEKKYKDYFNGNAVVF